VVFDGFERLDLEGPVGVLGWAGRLTGERLDVRFLSKHGRPVRDHLLARDFQVDGATGEATGFDLLIVPGGDRHQFAGDKELVGEIWRLGSDGGTVASVCTGAFLVAQTGLVDGRRITTHWQARDAFRRQFPHLTLSENRYEQDGPLWSSAGISAGIDMALRLVISVWGEAAGRKVQDMLEYYPEPPLTRVEADQPGVA
jgi:transcriptional regulator GlxA family with amidase domain